MRPKLCSYPTEVLWDQTTQSAWRLYATAIERFQQRFPQAVVPRLPERDAFPAARKMDELSAVPADLKSWIRAMEDITFMLALQDMGATKEASRLAFRAIRNRPRDRQIRNEAGPNSPLSVLYRGSRKVYRALKFVWPGDFAKERRSGMLIHMADGAELESGWSQNVRHLFQGRDP